MGGYLDQPIHVQDAITRWLPYVIDQALLRAQGAKSPDFIPAPDPRDSEKETEEEAPETVRARALRTLQRARLKAGKAIRAYRQG